MSSMSRLGDGRDVLGCCKIFRKPRGCRRFCSDLWTSFESLCVSVSIAGHSGRRTVPVFERRLCLAVVARDFPLHPQLARATCSSGTPCDRAACAV